MRLNKCITLAGMLGALGCGSSAMQAESPAVDENVFLEMQLFPGESDTFNAQDVVMKFEYLGPRFGDVRAEEGCESTYLNSHVHTCVPPVCDDFIKFDIRKVDSFMQGTLPFCSGDYIEEFGYKVRVIIDNDDDINVSNNVLYLRLSRTTE